MANWKKVIVSGSDAHLAAITSSVLVNNNILVAGVSGALESSGITYDGSELGLGSSIITSTGATSVLSGSFSGSFQGDGSGLSGVIATAGFALTDGNGIADFTYDGGTNGIVVAVEVSGSTLTVGSAGVAVAAGGITTVELADNSVTAAKLDDVFTDNGGVAGTFGSSTSVPVITVDEQGRLTSASLAPISTTLAISGSTSGNDTVSLITDALTFAGAGGITSTVTNNTVTVGTAGSGFISASAEGDAQGQIKLNGVNVDANALGSGDSPTFANLTLTGDLSVNGDITYLNTTNLAVEDRFILLASGSNAAGDGGIVIQQSTQGAGEVFGFDSATSRWAVTGSFDSTATAFTPDAFLTLNIASDSPSTADARFQKAGNIAVSTNGDIWIYS